MDFKETVFDIEMIEKLEDEIKEINSKCENISKKIIDLQKQRTELLSKQLTLELIRDRYFKNEVDTIKARQIEFEMQIHHQLELSGLFQKTKGYTYLVDAIALYIKDKSCMSNIMIDVYAVIANKNHTSAANVERCMRSSLNTYSQTPQYTDYFTNVLKQRPSHHLRTSDFITLVGGYILEQRTK